MKKYLFFLTAISVMAVSCNSADEPELQLPTASDSLDSSRQNLPTTVIKNAVMFEENEVRATGNEPFWNLDLSRDSVVFQLLEIQEYRELLPEPMINTKDSLRYQVHTVDDVLDILITNKPCTDDMSGFKKRFTAEVHIQRKTNEITYKGCADYMSEYGKGMEGRSSLVEEK